MLKGDSGLLYRLVGCLSVANYDDRAVHHLGDDHRIGDPQDRWRVEDDIIILPFQFMDKVFEYITTCLLYTSPSPRD